MAELVYVDEQLAQANQVIRSAVASRHFEKQEVVIITPAPTIEETIELILEHHCKVLITDYKLSDHKADVEFTGVELVQEFRSRFKDFPCFVTTSFPAEAVDETLDTNMIFPKSDFLGKEEDGASELPFFLRVRKKIDEYERCKENTKARFEHLNERLRIGPLNPGETQELIDLDSLLESYYGAQHTVSKFIKEGALQTQQEFGVLIEKAELLIAQIETEMSGNGKNE